MYNPIKVLVVALTNRDAQKLERLIISANRQVGTLCSYSGMVVCNTKDTSYPTEAKEVADRWKWDFLQTESNGTPGRGKNSVLEWFSNSQHNYQYLVLIDGDDILYPFAFQQLEYFMSERVDVLGLQTNDILDTRIYEGTAFAPVTDTVKLYSWFDAQFNLYESRFRHQVDRRGKRLGEHSTPDRIVLFSRQASALLRCSERLPVYEDYVLSINAQYEHVLGNLRYMNTSTTCVYVYDKTGESSVCKDYLSANNGDWGKHHDIFIEDIEPFEHVLRGFEAWHVPYMAIPIPKEMLAVEYRINFLRSLL